MICETIREHLSNPVGHLQNPVRNTLICFTKICVDRGTIPYFKNDFTAISRFFMKKQKRIQKILEVLNLEQDQEIFNA